MAHKHGVARGSYNHTQHGDPQVRHADRCPGTIPDTQHVAHGFEEGIGVLLTPRNILQEKGTGGETQRGVWGNYCKKNGLEKLLFDESLNFNEIFVILHLKFPFGSHLTFSL